MAETTASDSAAGLPIGGRADGGEAPRLRAETDAVVAGSVAAVAAALVALPFLLGRLTALWTVGVSVGLIAGLSAFIVAATTGALVYWRSRHDAGQDWRLGLPPWKAAVDTGTVALVHAGLATITTVTVFVVLQRSFEGLTVDAFIGTLAVAASAGLTGYLTATSVSNLNTRKLATLLVMYLAMSTLASIAAVQDPMWWQYHFSRLGIAGNLSSFLFNAALVVAGLFVTTFSLYLHRDLTTLVERGVLAHAWAPRRYATLFIVMGILLAGVGVFPLSVSILLHNLCAAGMSAVFATMALASPSWLRGLPKRFFVLCYAVFAVLIGGLLLFEPIGYWNLTAFELVAFSLIFGWITVFIRFVNAVAAGPTAAVPTPPTS